VRIGKRTGLHAKRFNAVGKTQEATEKERIAKAARANVRDQKRIWV
jgi:hypothetical protein